MWRWYHYLQSTLISSPDLQICISLSHHCPFFTFALLFVTCTCREIIFQIQVLLDLSWFSVYYGLPILICLFCLEWVFMDFYLFQYVKLILSNKAKGHMCWRKKTELCRLSRNCNIQFLHLAYLQFYLETNEHTNKQGYFHPLHCFSWS